MNKYRLLQNNINRQKIMLLSNIHLQFQLFDFKSLKSNYMTFRNLKFILFVGTLSLGCSQYNQDNILLQIGEYKLTVDDYEKLKVQYLDYSNDQIEKQLIEDGYIMAH